MIEGPAASRCGPFRVRRDVYKRQAKGGIALAVSHELGLPVLKIGVGEGLDDLRDFDAHDFARALVGEFDERA